MEYSGETNLNVMKIAKNYNTFLVDYITASLSSSAVVNRKIIDFGSGDGYFSAMVSARIGEKIINIEPAENMVRYYQEPPLKSLDDIEEQSVDFIYSLNVLEHIENDTEIVQKFYQVLKTGGSVLLYLPAFPCLYSSMDKKVGHYRRYTSKDANRLFNPQKWEIECLKYADFLGWFISLLFKYIGNDKGDISPTCLKIYDKLLFPVSKFLDKITFGKILGKNIIIKIKKK